MVANNSKFNILLFICLFYSNTFFCISKENNSVRSSRIAKKNQHILQRKHISLKSSNSDKALPEGFVYLRDIDPTIQVSIRYSTCYNFTGRIIKGYNKNTCILSRKAAIALSNAQKELTKISGGRYSLKIYDAYRPQKSSKDIMAWSKDKKDTKMKNIFFPKFKDKESLFKKGYIARRSSHSRGSTVDVTIIDMNKPCVINEETYEDNSIDMGTVFDYFGEMSHTNSKNISPEASNNRKLLCDLLRKHGFRNYHKEWWHFTLIHEAFPNQGFDFDIE